MNELRELARKLLADGEVRVIIGWEDARRGARPCSSPSRTAPTG